jgi:hypothetical protein
MQKNLLVLLYEQDYTLDNINNNMETSNNYLEQALNDIDIASNLQFRYIPVILGCSFGLVTFGPLALIPAFKIGGLLTGIGAGSVGGYMGYKYQ